MARSPGRPRAVPPRPGLSTEEEILQACARLFCGEGYGRTSTHRIAREARVSQATLYHYFAGKHEMLLTLLLRTVRPSVEFAEAVVAEEGLDAAVALSRLCAFDARLLASGEDNLGLLYFLPELSDPAFAPFHEERRRLHAAYRALVAAASDVAEPEAEQAAGFVFGLVESVIVRRLGKAGPLDGDLPERLAEAALRLAEIVPTDGPSTAC